MIILDETGSLQDTTTSGQDEKIRNGIQPEKPVDAPNWELKASPARARLGLCLGFTTLASARHIANSRYSERRVLI